MLESKKNAVLAVDHEGNSPLHLACRCGNSAPILYLLSSLSFDTAFICSAVLQENKESNTPLHLACIRNHIAVIDCMLGHPALSDECTHKAVMKHNKMGYTLLHIACNSVDADLLKCILKHLKEDTIRLSLQSLTPNTGKSPLHLACEKNSLGIITCLLNIGFSKDLVKSVFHVLSVRNHSLLHAASRCRESISIPKLLVELQLCNVMHQNDRGDTAPVSYTHLTLPTIYSV